MLSHVPMKACTRDLGGMCCKWFDSNGTGKMGQHTEEDRPDLIMCSGAQAKLPLCGARGVHDHTEAAR